MRKVIFSLVVASFLVGGLTVLAETVPTSDVGITPDSPFYFLKTWKENIQTFLTFGAENKARQFLHLADVRLAEYQKMIEKGKTEIAQKTLDKYERQLSRVINKVEELKSRDKDVKDISEKIASSTVKHIEVLESNLQKVPEAAKQGLEKAIENAKKINKSEDETTEWIGAYEYNEFAPPNQTWVYKIEIYKEEGQLKVRLDVDGFQTLTRIQATAKERNKNLDIVFDSYRPEDIYPRHKQGDLLFSLQKISEENYKIIWSKIQSNLLEPGVAEFKKIIKETTDWNIYNNPEVNFIFNYPKDWEIIDDYFYETLSGEKAKNRTVNLRKIGTDEWISINQRQFLCGKYSVRCVEIDGNIMGTYSEDLEVLKIRDEIVSTFKVNK